MALLCYHAAHEQFAPSHLLDLVVKAEQAGFDGIHSSDHFHPWSVRQGQSGYSFSWMGAAMQATTLPFSMVCAPGQRYHPAIVAQAIATLAELFPQRLVVELGSGEALNEMITGDAWPAKAVRNERLLECAVIIRRLLLGEEVSFDGHVRVQEAKLYSLPIYLPPLFCAAVSATTARWAGPWADGLLTTAQEPAVTWEKVAAFRDNHGADKPVHLQFAFSYARNREEALMGAWDQWRSNLAPPEKLTTLYKPEQFDETGKDISPEEVAGKVPIFTDIEQLMERVAAYEQPGVTRIILHNVNRLQEGFIEDFGNYLKQS
ncbi:TIGR03557 family F420-dependent LLM class oxidoreductase [Paraflavitalea soli]|uniref:TIGR03557 family F420-dependent LLM class oxidoreductase n=1 Tax=Paraflavitalea soli TaxID=2315862 RepID=A0A3B7MGJ7_9BACT|nr:TIGR03885 family FMN-dependent LLM class oxidoreductase [Paraflavitalea soli]AXY72717.1 TIGR03557 family F420-dependent LLM class oxidoreductase [Paraflavitalea soli]